MIPVQADVRNRLLALMAPEDFAHLAPHLTATKLPRGFVVAEPDEPVRTVYFIECGVVSIVATSPEGLEIEAGIFGRDGFGPVAPLMDVDTAGALNIVQVPDDAWALPTKALTTAVDASVNLRKLLTRYVQTLMLQVAHTALANGLHQIDERLTRWLLMIDDRSEGGEFPLTHEFMSTMLGVRRPSVTTSLHVLEGNGFIRAERGCIRIVNRAAMERFAGDSYGKPEAAYARTIGPMRAPLQQAGLGVSEASHASKRQPVSAGAFAPREV